MMAGSKKVVIAKTFCKKCRNMNRKPLYKGSVNVSLIMEMMSTKYWINALIFFIKQPFLKQLPLG